MSDLPESHARLVFAVLLFRDALLSAADFRGELTAAFGEAAGAEIATIIMRGLAFPAGDFPVATAHRR